MLFGFALGWLAHSESQKENVYIMHYVSKGGCLNEFSTAMSRCRFDKHPDEDKCIKATSALRKCFAKRPDHFTAYFTDRIDNGLNQDTNPTPEEIEADARTGTYRWWAGMKRRD